MDLNGDGKVTLAERVQYAAGKAGEKIDQAMDQLKAEAKDTAADAKIYVGEELPLDYLVCISRNIPYNVSLSQTPSFETGGGVANCIGNYHVRLWCSDGVFIKEKFLNEELASPSMLLPTGTYPYDAIKARSLYPNKLELLHGNSVRCVREDCQALPIASVQLNQSSATLGDGETVQLSATLLPGDTANRTVREVQ